VKENASIVAARDHQDLPAIIVQDSQVFSHFWRVNAVQGFDKVLLGTMEETASYKCFSAR
jgi:hypothetical protein